MKSNINESPLKSYSRIPSFWEPSKHIKLYNTASPEIHYADGFRDVVIPAFNTETQKRGKEIYDAVNDVVTYEVIDLSPEEIDQSEEQALDSDESAQKLSQAISDGQIMYQRFFAEIQRLLDKGTITGNQAKNSVMLLWNPLLPINYGQFIVSKLILESLPPPINAKELAILNKAKEHIDNYLK